MCISKQRRALNRQLQKYFSYAAENVAKAHQQINNIHKKQENRIKIAMTVSDYKNELNLCNAVGAKCLHALSACRIKSSV